ncbi:MAG: hypothetical protein GX875_01865 [Propionibacterium sp.]|nr:hypothetical protein [Propionibacterium sp.]
MPTATCPVCKQDITYEDRDAFRDHVNGHPRCGMCGRRFTSNTALGSHALTCHKGSLDPDDLPWGK